MPKLSLPSMPPLRTPPAFRVRLALKAVLLVALGGGLVWLAKEGATRSTWPALARGAWALVFGAVGLFPLGPARRGLADALDGAAVEVTDAVALDARGRRAGYSLRLPDGRFAEFLLWNPGPALVPGARYRLLLARRSRTIAATPAPTQSPAGTPAMG